MIEWEKKRGERWDEQIVGEKKKKKEIGEMIKIGRRGQI